MRIKAFHYFIETHGTKNYGFKDSSVVIDGFNFFYTTYQKSNLPFKFGCESDKYAEFLKGELLKFENANLRCYFVFKGGNEDMQKKFDKARKFYIDDQNVDIPRPPLISSIWKQVLAEMKFDYVNCPLEPKDYCITLAKKLNCPIISQDMQYALSSVSYIPHKQMSYDKETKSFSCVVFNKQDFYRKFRLDMEKFIIFIVLTDSDCFPENYFINFFKAIRAPLNHYKRILHLLHWLAHLSKDEALNKIFQFTKLSRDDRMKFFNMQKKVREILNKRETGIPLNLFLHGDSMKITRNDPKWFEKGVLNNFIAKPYTVLYYSDLLIYKSSESDDKMLLPTNIIVYAYNLLTNYTKEKIQLRNKIGELIIEVDTRTLPFPKPEYEAVVSVFENGWDSIRDLGLFEHFLKGSMKGIDLSILEGIPEDAKLLMITLTYFTTIIKTNETLDELYSILSSYIILGVVFDDQKHDNITKKFAINATKTYFQLNCVEINLIYDKEMINSLFEFQYCLEQINYLNTLCGSPFRPTIYSKTYNATFVYKLLYELKTKGVDRVEFFANIFQSVPTVFLYLQELFDFHKRLVSSIEK